MRSYWLRLSDRFDNLSSRERWIIFVSLALSLCTAVFLLFIDPALARRKQYQQQIQQSQISLSKLQAEEQALAQLSLQDPDADTHQHINLLLQKNQVTRAELAQFQMQLAPPEKMPRLLADLLARQPGLELLGIKTLNTENMLQNKAEPPDQDNAAAKPGVYRHGLEVSIRGDYAALTNYARKIEQLPWKFYWGDMQFKVEQYPVSVMTFTLYTVSLDPAWLSL